LKKHNDKNIKDVIADFIRDNQKVTQGFNKARIGEIWKSEMGPVITSYTQKMTFHKGTLKGISDFSTIEKGTAYG
jgi:hypothetical protein